LRTSYNNEQGEETATKEYRLFLPTRFHTPRGCITRNCLLDTGSNITILKEEERQNRDLQKSKTANYGSLLVNELHNTIHIENRWVTTNHTVYSANLIHYKGILGADWCHNVIITKRQVHPITKDDNDSILNENKLPQREKPEDKKKTHNTFEKELNKKKCYKSFFSETNELPRHNRWDLDIILVENVEFII
jgi:hypothetical protein